jgi:hypothetical protein
MGFPLKLTTSNLIVFMIFLLSSMGYSAVSVTYTISTEQDRAAISPYIYGFNFDHVTAQNLTVRRMGGNRMTGYNWENNYSNAGSDWQHSSDENICRLIFPQLSEKPRVKS